MKKSLLILLWSVFSMQLMAQLPDGSTAPDWTLSDINGNTHHLYAYLDSGYTVYIDFSATWCGPCWNYHNTHALADLYNAYGPNGTNEVRVFFIEGDATTNIDCLYGLSSCSGSTQGNWVDGTPYPIINSSTQNGPYQVPYWPTIYGICSNYEISLLGQLSTSQHYAFHQACPAPNNLDVTAVNITDVLCAGTATGSVDISVSGGSGSYTYLWSHGATTEDLFGVPAGVYAVTATDVSTGSSGFLNDIFVDEPSAMSMVQTFYNPVTCQDGGNNGAVGYWVNGGQAPYSYLWSNFDNGPEAYNLPPGTYSLVASDINGCTISSGDVVFEAPETPTAIIAPPDLLSCTVQVVQLDGSGSSSGGNYTYQWSTNTGNIVSGANTLFPIVDAPGEYTLIVTNTLNGCTESESVIVEMSSSATTVNAYGGTINCSNASVTLDVTADPTGVSFAWTGPNGYTSALENPTVTVAGTYSVVVTTANGCTGSASTMVTSDVDAPDVTATGGAMDCNNTSVTLMANSNTDGVTYSWSGPNGFSSTEQNPTVSVAGSYTVSVLNPANGCSSAQTVTVSNDNSVPNVNAVGGEMNCMVSTITLMGSSSANEASYSWAGPNGFTSSEQNPTVNSVGDYVLVVTDLSNGCSASAVASVTQDNTVPDVAVLGGTITCAVPTVTLMASSNTDNVTFSWSGPGGFSSSDPTVTVDLAGTYAVTVTAPNGCTASTSATVNSDMNTPEADATGGVIDCNNSSVTLNGFSSVDNSTFAWSGPGGYSSADQNPTVSVVGQYTLTVTAPNGCTDVVTTQVTANSNIPNVSAQGGDLTCSNPTVMLFGSSTTDGVTFSWTGPNGFSSTEQNPVVSMPGTYTLTVNAPNGCAASTNVTVEALNDLTVFESFLADVSCHGGNDGSIDISVTGGSGNYTFQWSNNETTEDINNLTADTYSVVVSDGSNCTAQLNIVIGEPTAILLSCAEQSPASSPTAADGVISGNINGGVMPYSILVNGNVQNTNFPGGSFTIPNLVPGSYVISIVDANGCTAYCITVINVPACTLQISEQHQDVNCANMTGGSIGISASGANGNLTYQWSPSTVSGSHPTNLDAGTYQVSVTDEANCTDMLTIHIQATNLNVNLGDIQPLCANDAPVQLTGSPLGGSFSGVGVAGSLFDPFVAGAGNHTIDYSYSGAFGCNGNDQTVITVNPIPQVDAGTYTEICHDDDPIQLVSNPTGGTFSGAGVMDNTFNPAGLSAGTYVVTVSYQDGNGCMATAETDIVVVNCACTNPPQAFAGADKVVCANNDFIQLNGTIGGSATSATWSGGQGSFSPNSQALNPTYTPTSAEISAGEMTLLFTTNDPDGNGPCVAAQDMMTIQFNEVVTPEFTQVPALCQSDQPVTLPTTSENNINGTWAPSVIDPANGTFVTATFTPVANQCALSVSMTVEVIVSVTPEFIPVGPLCQGGNPVTLPLTSENGITGTWEPVTVNPNSGEDQVSVFTPDAGQCAASTQLTTEVIPAPEVSFDVQVASGELMSDGGVVLTIEGTEDYQIEWYFDGVLVSSSKDLENVKPGVYVCKITDELGCSSIHSVEIGFVVAIGEPDVFRTLDIYPNPVSHQLFIELPGVVFDYQILDLYGKRLLTQKDAFAKANQDVNSFGQGIYFVKVITQEGHAFRKIVITK